MCIFTSANTNKQKKKPSLLTLLEGVNYRSVTNSHRFFFYSFPNDLPCLYSLMMTAILLGELVPNLTAVTFATLRTERFFSSVA